MRCGCIRQCGCRSVAAPFAVARHPGESRDPSFAVALARHPREGGDPGTFHALPVLAKSNSKASVRLKPAGSPFFADPKKGNPKKGSSRRSNPTTGKGVGALRESASCLRAQQRTSCALPSGAWGVIGCSTATATATASSTTGRKVATRRCAGRSRAPFLPSREKVARSAGRGAPAGRFNAAGVNEPLWQTTSLRSSSNHPALLQ